MSVKDADGHKLLLYPKEVSRVLEGDLNNSLLQVEIGPINLCNHNCSYCSLDWIKRDGSNIEKKAMFNALEDMAKMGVPAVYFAGEGEPLLHKDTPEFIKRSNELGMGVSLSTNGSLLTEKVSKEILPYLSWIRIGIDAATPETYSIVHGTRKSDFQKTMNNLITAARIKKENNYKVDIGVQSLILSENASETVNLTKLIKWTGVDNLQIKPFAQHPFARERGTFTNYDSSNLKKEVEKFEDENFKVVYREETIKRVTNPAAKYKECLGLSFWTLIDAKGNVIPCNPFYDKPEFSFGNIHKQSFKEIWEGDKRKKVMKSLKRDECKEYRCRPDIFNRYMFRLKNKEPNDCFI
jgi:radical SAM protein with 4Fe4S-binding SPASM domain